MPGHISIPHVREGKTSRDDPTKSETEIEKTVRKDRRFVLASDIWATLDDEQKEELKKKMAGELNHSEGKLIAELRQMEADKLEAMEKYKDLTDETKSLEERELVKAEMIEKLQSEIDVLKSRDVEEELAARDAQIRTLEKQKAALNKKLKEPDLNKTLEDCIKKQRDVSVILSDIFKNKSDLDAKLLSELGILMMATMATIRNDGRTVLQIGD